MGEEREVYKVLMGKCKGKRPFERPSHRWEGGVKVDLGRVWIVFNWLRIGTGGGLFEQGDEPLGSGATE
jgi:hypothetical protein